MESIFLSKVDPLAADVSKERYDALRDEAIRILHFFGNKSHQQPGSMLNEYYRTQKVVNLEKMYVSICRQENFKKKRTLYWQYEFKCPLNKGVCEVSVLAQALLVAPQTPQTSAAEELRTKSMALFGKTKIFNHQVYFTTKRGAKEAAALAMLLRLHDDPRCAFDFENGMPSQEGTVSAVKGARTSYPKKSHTRKNNHKKKSLAIPGWVDKLYAVSVRHVTIRYQEQRLRNDMWKAQPTLLICTLSIKKPIALSLTGTPFSSKVQALESAVDMLCEKLQATAGKRRVQEPLFDFAMVMEEKERLLLCDTSSTFFVYPVPIPMTKLIVPRPNGKIGYMYEVVISRHRDNIATPLACSVLGIPHEEASRIGILVGQDIFSDSKGAFSSHELCAPFMFQHGVRGKCNVRLLSKTALLVDEMSEAREKIEKLKWFNQTLVHWTRKGAHPSKNQKARCNSGQGRSEMTRSCIFFPLIPNATNGIAIDWALVDKILSGKAESYLEINPTQSRLPIVGGLGLAQVLIGFTYALPAWAALCFGEKAPVHLDLLPQAYTALPHSMQTFHLVLLWVLLYTLPRPGRQHPKVSFSFSESVRRNRLRLAQVLMGLIYAFPVWVTLCVGEKVPMYLDLLPQAYAVLPQPWQTFYLVLIWTLLYTVFQMVRYCPKAGVSFSICVKRNRLRLAQVLTGLVYALPAWMALCFGKNVPLHLQLLPQVHPVPLHSLQTFYLALIWILIYTLFRVARNYPKVDISFSVSVKRNRSRLHQVLIGLVYTLPLMVILCVGEKAPVHLDILPQAYMMLPHSMQALYLVLIGVLLYTLLPPRQRHPKVDVSLSTSVMRNRFLSPDTDASSLYVLSSELCPALNGNSFFAMRQIASMKTSEVNLFKRKWGLDLRSTTFRDYVQKQFGIHIRYPKRELIHASRVLTNNILASTFPDATKKTPPSMYLFSELTKIYPIPRDLLFLVCMAGSYMPAVEQEVVLVRNAHRLQQMSFRTASFFNNTQPGPSLSEDENKTGKIERSLISLLSRAITLHPRKTYERLEFLGDSVLGYFLAINMFAKNSALQWNETDLAGFCEEAGRNSTLYTSALRAGLNRLAGRGPTQWKDAFMETKGAAKRSKNSDAVQNLVSLFGYSDVDQLFEIKDKTLSDMVESLLAASYLADMDRERSVSPGYMTIAVLEVLSLPLPHSNSGSESLTWFVSPGRCLRAGYPFDLDSEWMKRISEVCDSLFRHLSTKGLLQLDTKLNHLLSIFHEGRPNDVVIDDYKKRFFLVALFDENENSLRIKSDKATTLESMSHFFRKGQMQESADHRTAFANVDLVSDNLFLVGNYGLQLVLTEELYRLNPRASLGDLNLIRNCLESEETLTYILVEWGIHETLFDEENQHIKQVLDIKRDSDDIGHKIWEKHGGWILPGGIATYRARLQKYFGRDEHQTAIPRYPGLAGGRLLGQDKLPSRTAGDLAISFKCIAGAFVLAFGTEGLRRAFRPLFEELLLLSADEMRQVYGDVSAICRNVAKGNSY